MEETSDEDWKDQREIKTIRTNHTLIYKKTLLKFDKPTCYEKISKQWLYNFTFIGLWGR